MMSMAAVAAAGDVGATSASTVGGAVDSAADEIVVVADASAVARVLEHVAARCVVALLAEPALTALPDLDESARRCTPQLDTRRRA